MSARPAILIVDDRSSDLDALEGLLKDLDAEVLRAGSGREALRHLLHRELALLVLDVEMPGLDGLETARLVRARKRTRHLPILFVTAHDPDAGHLSDAYRLNAVDVVCKPVLAEAVRAKVQVFIDLHALRERERESAALLERRAAQAERSNADLSMFAHVAAHDMQEPLTTVRRYLRLLGRRRADELGEEGRSFLASASAEVERLGALLRDLLAYAEIPAGPARREVVPLAALVGRARQALAERIESSGALIDVGPLPELPCDAGQLTRVFQNLLGNALKFTAATPPRLSVRAEARPGGWLLRFDDDGIGVPETESERIFEPFERLHARSEHEGTGLGLAICRRIVEAHGGRIWVEPGPEGGSTFKLTLPHAEHLDAARHD